MSESIKEQVRLLKQDFRTMMNGPVSASLREKGLNYSVIYGIEWQRLVDIASQTGFNHELAQALWKEDIRECRLLAGLVQPAETFLPEIADIWIDSMHYPEEAQYTTMSIFQRMPEASTQAFLWIADEREMFQLCGWLLLSRLLMRGAPLNFRSEDEFVDQAEVALHSSNLHIAVAVRNAVIKYAQIGSREELRVNKLLQQCQF